MGGGCECGCGCGCKCFWRGFDRKRFWKGFELLMGSFCKRVRELDQKYKKELTKKLLKVKN